MTERPGPGRGPILLASCIVIGIALPGLSKLPGPLPTHQPTTRVDTVPGFVGAEACADCHDRQYGAWARSTHGRAGGPPDDTTLAVPFDGTPMTFADAVVTPTVVDSVHVFIVRTAAGDTVIPVTGTVGRGHPVGGGNQGFVTTTSDGTMQFLPFDYSVTAATWFCNTGGRTDRGWVPINADLSIQECGDWPPVRLLGDAPGQATCQQCHGSQIALRFDPDTRTFQSAMTSLRVNCESCHGPGQAHVNAMRSGTANADVGMRSLATLDKDQHLAVCFQCHAVKGIIEPGYVPGADLERHYVFRLPLLSADLFTPDGRLQSFGYQGNHLASECYLAGSMTCGDCHDPHSQSYRDVFGTPLANRFSNGQCTGCHPSKEEEVERHTAHAPDSQASLCVTCHMPFRQAPTIGSAIPYARSDHTIPVPRADLDASLGFPSVCQSCHPGVTGADLQARIDSIWGPPKPPRDMVEALTRPEWSSPVAAARELLDPSARDPIGQIMALRRFVGEFIQPDMPRLEPEIERRLRSWAESPDKEVAAAALAVLHLAVGDDPVIRASLAPLMTQRTPEDSARGRRWISSLLGMGSLFLDLNRASDALDAYRKALEIDPNHAGALLNTAGLLNAAGQPAAAIPFYEQAIAAWDATALNATVTGPNLAYLTGRLGDALIRAGRTAEGLARLEEAVARDPREVASLLLLGQQRLARGQAAEALDLFADVVRIVPGRPEGHLSMAAAHATLGNIPAALAALDEALRIDPTYQPALDLRNRLTSRN